ncbi:hypothetical protein FACS1894186_4960 [Alphaproteobacteria bacterium]|nr:hypothetical protein FACS1894186_4960 [Alphaproteobacteria bacterium]
MSNDKQAMQAARAVQNGTMSPRKAIATAGSGGKVPSRPAASAPKKGK